MQCHVIGNRAPGTKFGNLTMQAYPRAPSAAWLKHHEHDWRHCGDHGEGQQKLIATQAKRNAYPYERRTMATNSTLGLSSLTSPLNNDQRSEAMCQRRNNLYSVSSYDELVHRRPTMVPCVSRYPGNPHKADINIHQQTLVHERFCRSHSSLSQFGNKREATKNLGELYCPSKRYYNVMENAPKNSFSENVFNVLEPNYSVSDEETVRRYLGARTRNKPPPLVKTASPDRNGTPRSTREDFTISQGRRYRIAPLFVSESNGQKPEQLVSPPANYSDVRYTVTTKQSKQRRYSTSALSQQNTAMQSAQLLRRAASYGCEEQQRNNQNKIQEYESAFHFPEGETEYAREHNLHKDNNRHDQHVTKHYTRCSRQSPFHCEESESRVQTTFNGSLAEGVNFQSPGYKNNTLHFRRLTNSTNSHSSSQNQRNLENSSSWNVGINEKTRLSQNLFVNEQQRISKEHRNVSFSSRDLDILQNREVNQGEQCCETKLKETQDVLLRNHQAIAKSRFSLTGAPPPLKRVSDRESSATSYHSYSNPEQLNKVKSPLLIKSRPRSYSVGIQPPPLRPITENDQSNSGTESHTNENNKESSLPVSEVPNKENVDHEIPDKCGGFAYDHNSLPKIVAVHSFISGDENVLKLIGQQEVTQSSVAVVMGADGKTVTKEIQKTSHQEEQLQPELGGCPNNNEKQLQPMHSGCPNNKEEQLQPMHSGCPDNNEGQLQPMHSGCPSNNEEQLQPMHSGYPNNNEEQLQPMLSGCPNNDSNDEAVDDDEVVLTKVTRNGHVLHTQQSFSPHETVTSDSMCQTIPVPLSDHKTENEAYQHEIATDAIHTSCFVHNKNTTASKSYQNSHSVQSTATAVSSSFDSSSLPNEVHTQFNCDLPSSTPKFAISNVTSFHGSEIQRSEKQSVYASSSQPIKVDSCVQAISTRNVSTKSVAANTVVSHAAYTYAQVADNNGSSHSNQTFVARQNKLPIYPKLPLYNCSKGKNHKSDYNTKNANQLGLKHVSEESNDSPKVLKKRPSTEELCKKISNTRERMISEKIPWKKKVLLRLQMVLLKRLRKTELETGEKATLDVDGISAECLEMLRLKTFHQNDESKKKGAKGLKKETHKQNKQKKRSEKSQNKQELQEESGYLNETSSLSIVATREEESHEVVSGSEECTEMSTTAVKSKMTSSHSKIKRAKSYPVEPSGCPVHVSHRKQFHRQVSSPEIRGNSDATRPEPSPLTLGETKPKIKRAKSYPVEPSGYPVHVSHRKQLHRQVSSPEITHDIEATKCEPSPLTLGETKPKIKGAKSYPVENSANPAHGSHNRKLRRQVSSSEYSRKRKKFNPATLPSCDKSTKPKTAISKTVSPIKASNINEEKSGRSNFNGLNEPTTKKKTESPESKSTNLPECFHRVPKGLQNVYNSSFQPKSDLQRDNAKKISSWGGAIKPQSTGTNSRYSLQGESHSLKIGMKRQWLMTASNF